MLSRVAERIYWGGRYLERAENTARMVSTYAGVLLDLPAEAGMTWHHLVAIADAETSFAARYRKADEKSVLAFLITDRENPGSIVSSVAYARENFRTTRDVLPREAWESINSLYLFSRDNMARQVPRRQLHQVLTRCVNSCQQVSGALSETMSHGDAYQFLVSGRTLERADMNSRTIDAVASAFAVSERLRTIHENTLWMAVLKSQSAYQMYRQFAHRRVARRDVLDFLVKNELFPRSMLHCLHRLAGSLAGLPLHEKVYEPVARLADRIGNTDLAAFEGPPLHEWIDGLQVEFNQIHEEIESTWFLPAHSA
jgi:uncharacterized alpha-E superfamily protein